MDFLKTIKDGADKTNKMKNMKNEEFRAMQENRKRTVNYYK